jgi:hypothetical protein
LTFCIWFDYCYSLVLWIVVDQRLTLQRWTFANVEANTQIRRFWEAKFFYSMFWVINCVPGCIVWWIFTKMVKQL